MTHDGNVTGPSKRLLTPEEAAEYLKVTVKTLANWRHLGIGPRYCKVGGRLVRYRLSDLDDFLAAGDRPAA